MTDAEKQAALKRATEALREFERALAALEYRLWVQVMEINVWNRRN